MSRSRAFIFTINNWTVDHVFTLSRLEAQYIVYGKEVGAQGTPHLQGYVYFKTQRTLQSVIKKLQEPTWKSEEELILKRKLTVRKMVM